MNLAGRLERVETAAARVAGVPAALPPDAAALMERCGLPPDRWQRDLLRGTARQVLLCCSRQSGKSTVVAALGLHEALYRPGSLVLLLAPALRQAQLLYRKVLTFYGALGRPVAAAAETALSLTLANGSQIVALPGKEETIRGYSAVRLLLVDEAARVPDALYVAVRPMLAVSGGRVIGLSTPHGRRGWLHREWTEGGPGWERVRIPAEQCPRIAPEFLAAERLALGPWWYAQEYDCEFMDSEDQVFSGQHIDAAMDDDVAPLFPAAEDEAEEE